MNMRRINVRASRIRPLVIALSIAAALPALAIAQEPATGASTTDASETEATTLDGVVVTGSRIRRSQVEGPSPVMVIDSAQIEREGFITISDALNTLTQGTGQIQTEMDAGTFTQNANAINLRGLGPGRVLTLIDGRRATDYPLPFNGQSNIVNLGALPAAAVDRIELLAGGASAIYGSDAVAGVLNIVLKKRYDGLAVNATLGGTDSGGGASKRLQLVGGGQAGGLDLVYTFEYLDRQPIWAFQREVMDSMADNPMLQGPVVNSRNALIYDPFDSDDDGYTYIDPTPAACAPLAPEVNYSFRPGFGFYCGRPDDISQFTIRNGSRDLSGYLNAIFDLDGGPQLFSSLALWKSDSELNTGTPFWYDVDHNFVIDAGADPSLDIFGVGGQTVSLQRFVTPREIGGRDRNNQTFDERTWTINAGVRGSFLDARFDYELAYTHGRYDVTRDRPLFLAQETADHFYGPQIGEVEGIPVYDIPRERIYQPFTPALYASLTGIDHTRADSSTDLLSLVVSGDLFDLPAGPVGFAGVLEWGSQEYAIDLDPRLVNGEFWGYTGTGGGGKRDRHAAGIEFRVPVLDSFIASLAGRYDKYDDITEVDDAFTYSLGLEWRPLDSLLLRGSYSTSFRAPDMHFVFAEPSGFFTTVVDEYLCRREQPGVPLPQCTVPDANPSGQRQGNPDLREETGKSWTYGLVWDAFEGFSVSADYYYIELEDMVNDLSISRLLQTEADCRLGATRGGEPVDINSAECQDTLARITRAPDDGTLDAERIRNIVVGPINRAFQSTSGIDLAARYRLDTGRWGEFNFDLSWSHVLDEKRAQFAEDPIVDYRDNPQNFDFRSRVRGSVNWRAGDWSTTVFGTRYGSTPNWYETTRIGSWTKYNLNVSYRFNERMTAAIIVNNVLDKAPPRDPTFDTYPYFSTANYDPYGREAFVQFDYRFN